MLGIDVRAKAGTGTGKTLAFLIPSIEALYGKNAKPLPRNHIGVLVLSPTRELAFQTSKEAETLLRYHPSAKVQCVVGGTSLSRDVQLLQQSSPSILVATPGRLLDLLQRRESDLQRACQQLKVFVFDEADRLLDEGFKITIDDILKLLPPKKNRQTLLFSATFPSSVLDIAARALRTSPEPAVINVAPPVVAGGGTEQTAFIPQRLMMTPMKGLIASTFEVLMRERTKQRRGEPSKVLVFLPTARQASFYAKVFNELSREQDEKTGLPAALELHSRKSQSARTKTSAAFRDARFQILFASDVAARGLDYPDVSLVVQVGAPESRECYTHRLGRTARAGKSGEGLLVLSHIEKLWLEGVLHGLPLNEEVAPALSGPMVQALERAVQRVHQQDKKLGSQAYIGFLGYYSTIMKQLKWDKHALVQYGNEFALELLSLPTTPILEQQIINKMGLGGFLFASRSAAHARN